MRIGIIGGGITGLVCAYYLVREGYRPVIMESRPYLGARGPRPTPASTDTSVHPSAGDTETPPITQVGSDSSCELDPFPVTLQRNDTATCGVIADLGLTPKLQWHVTRAGASSRGDLYPLSSWSDVLRFGTLPIMQRLRATALAYAGIRMRNYGRPLDSVQVRDWFVDAQGEEIYQAIWRPSIAARFGYHHVDDMPAYVAWQFLREEFSGASRMVGALRGGVATLYAELARKVVEGGGEIHLRTRVRQVQADSSRVRLDVGHGRAEFDAAISAIKLPALVEIAGGEFRASLPEPTRAPRMQQVTTLRVWNQGISPLAGYYRMLMFEPKMPFSVLMNGTPLLPREQREGRSVTYLLRLDSEREAEAAPSDAELERQGVQVLRHLAPSLDPSTLSGLRVFRWKSPDPIYTVHSLAHPTPKRLGKTSIHICTASQAYPKSASLESIVLLARECVGNLVRDQRLA